MTMRLVHADKTCRTLSELCLNQHGMHMTAALQVRGRLLGPCKCHHTWYDSALQAWHCRRRTNTRT